MPEPFGWSLQSPAPILLMIFSWWTFCDDRNGCCCYKRIQTLRPEHPSIDQLFLFILRFLPSVLLLTNIPPNLTLGIHYGTYLAKFTDRGLMRFLLDNGKRQSDELQNTNLVPDHFASSPAPVIQ